MDGLTEVRKLYLDLVQKCIINTIYEDPNQGFWSPKGFGRPRFSTADKGNGAEIGHRNWFVKAGDLIGEGSDLELGR